MPSNKQLYVYYEIDVEKIGQVCLEYRNDTLKDPSFKNFLEFIHLTGHVCYTDSKKIKVMMPVELEFSLTTKDEGFTLCDIYRDDAKQKCLRVYNLVPKEVFHHLMHLFLNYPRKLYFSFIAGEFCRNRLSVARWSIDSNPRYE